MHRQTLCALFSSRSRLCYLWRQKSLHTPPRSDGASDCVLDPRIRLHFEYFQSILENLSRGDRFHRLADAQNRADRMSDACRKAATRGVPQELLDLSVESPSARRLWRVAPSDGTGLAMMAPGSVGTGRAGMYFITVPVVSGCDLYSSGTRPSSSSSEDDYQWRLRCM